MNEEGRLPKPDTQVGVRGYPRGIHPTVTRQATRVVVTEMTQAKSHRWIWTLGV